MTGFKNLRKKVRRRRIETFLLAGYAFAVTCALFISLIQKSVNSQQQIDEITDNYDYTSDVLTPVFSDFQHGNPFEEAFTQVQSISLLSDNQFLVDKLVVTHNDMSEVVMPGEPKPKHRKQYGSLDGIYRKERHVVVVESGLNHADQLQEGCHDTEGDRAVAADDPRHPERREPHTDAGAGGYGV